MPEAVAIDTRDITITPVFKIIEVENIPKSETAGRAVMETKEVVEVRFAGTKNYLPVFPAASMWKREGNRVITFAERWPEQYRAFKEGNPQEADGTPLEMLKPHGITSEVISLCRALKIYSIEALYHLEGDRVKTLGMHQNKLKAAAREYMASRNDASSAMDEIAALKAEIAALKAVPQDVPTPEEVEKIEAKADASYADMTDAQLKDEIAKLAGAKPKGNPSRETLERSLTELLEAA